MRPGCGGSIASKDPLLGPLADNGGPTFTHALLPGSPAIDAASTNWCPDTDQRGVTRSQHKPGDEVVNPEGYHKMKHV